MNKKSWSLLMLRNWDMQLDVAILVVGAVQDLVVQEVMWEVMMTERSRVVFDL